MNHHMSFNSPNCVQQTKGFYKEYSKGYLCTHVSIFQCKFSICKNLVLMFQVTVTWSTQSFVRETYSTSWQTYPQSIPPLPRPSVRGARSSYSWPQRAGKTYPQWREPCPPWRQSLGPSRQPWRPLPVSSQPKK